MEVVPRHRSIAVVVPALDENENLELLLPRLNTVLSELVGTVFGIFVVAEVEPSAETCTLVSSLGATLIPRNPSNTFGDAIRSGIANVGSKYEFTVFMDADGSHSPTTIPAMLEKAGEADVVVASRYVPGGSSANSVPLRLMSRTLNQVYALVLGIDCRDISTNFKLYRTQDLKELHLQCAHFDIVEEILAKLSLKSAPDNLRITEIPDHFAQRRQGESKRRLTVFIVSYIWTLWRLRRHGKSSIEGDFAKTNTTSVGGGSDR